VSRGGGRVKSRVSTGGKAPRATFPPINRSSQGRKGENGAWKITSRALDAKGSGAIGEYSLGRRIEEGLAPDSLH